MASPLDLMREHVALCLTDSLSSTDSVYRHTALSQGQREKDPDECTLEDHLLLDSRTSTRETAPLPVLSFAATTLATSAYHAGFLGNPERAGLAFFCVGLVQMVAGHWELHYIAAPFKTAPFSTLGLTRVVLTWGHHVIMALILGGMMSVQDAISSLQASFLVHNMLLGAVSLSSVPRENIRLTFAFVFFGAMELLLVSGATAGSASLKTAAGYVGLVAAFAGIYALLSSLLFDYAGVTE